LDQNLREPEVVGCCIENAVQHDGHISFGAGEASLPEVALSRRNELGRPTSEVGQNRHFGPVPITSGVRPTPDMSLHRNN
jgi:hypothetical protein